MQLGKARSESWQSSLGIWDYVDDKIASLRQTCQLFFRGWAPPACHYSTLMRSRSERILLMTKTMAWMINFYIYTMGLTDVRDNLNNILTDLLKGSLQLHFPRKVSSLNLSFQGRNISPVWIIKIWIKSRKGHWEERKVSIPVTLIS